MCSPMFWFVLLWISTTLAPEIPSQTRAWVGARLIPVDGPEIPRGALLVEGPHIRAVGSVDELVIPDEAERIDASGMVITPGLVCTHSHLGGVGGADGSSPPDPLEYTSHCVGVVIDGVVMSREVR